MSTRQIFAYALVAIGALWLLIEVGFVPPSVTGALLEWWPLLLIGFGLDLVLPSNRRGPLPITVYAAASILLVAVFGISAPAGATSDEFQRQAPPEARSMNALLELGAAKSTIGPAAEGEAVSAQFRGQTPAKVELAGSTDLQFELRRGRSTIQFGRATWNIGLSPTLPTALDVRAGSGSVALNLSEFDLTSFTLDAGSGSTSLALPGGGRYYRADVDAGSGQLRLDVQPGASLDLALQTRSGSVIMGIGEGADVLLTLATRSGSVTIDLPQGAPIRLEILDDGSGSVRVPAYLTRRSSNGDTGVWQSSAFERGGRVINITVVDVGSGSITFR